MTYLQYSETLISQAPKATQEHKRRDVDTPITQADFSEGSIYQSSFPKMQISKELIPNNFMRQQVIVAIIRGTGDKHVAVHRQAHTKSPIMLMLLKIASISMT